MTKLKKAIENLWNALEQGQSVQKITERINMREAEKRELQKQLAMEQRKKIGFDYLHILAYLDYIRSLSNQDTIKKKALINIFVNSIYLYDDYYTIVLNGGNTSLTIENIPFKSIEKRFKIGVSGTFCSSSVVPSAPPNATETNPCIRGSSLSLYKQKSGTFVGPVYFNGGFAVLVWL